MHHDQNENLTEITTCMDHYVQQLKPIVSVELGLKADAEANASAALAALFVSLLGGLAWLCQLRGDIAVYVVALQRTITLRCMF